MDPAGFLRALRDSFVALWERRESSERGHLLPIVQEDAANALSACEAALQCGLGTDRMVDAVEQYARWVNLGEPTPADINRAASIALAIKEDPRNHRTADRAERIAEALLPSLFREVA